MYYQKSKTLFRNIISVCFIFLLLEACKKDKNDQQELPVLNTCNAVATKAGLVAVGDGNYEYTSAGGVNVKIERTNTGVTITLSDVSYPNIFTVQLWGNTSEAESYAAIHENVNGKHIKDRNGNNRTIFFPDGTKVTCVTAGPKKAVTAISIYDGAMAHHINVGCNKIEYSGSDATIAKRLDELQPDGETSTYELTATGLLFYNIYTEDTAGNKVAQRVELASLVNDNPNIVNDLYDDPRDPST